MAKWKDFIEKKARFATPADTNPGGGGLTGYSLSELETGHSFGDVVDRRNREIEERVRERDRKNREFWEPVDKGWNEYVSPVLEHAGRTISGITGAAGAYGKQFFEELGSGNVSMPGPVPGMYIPARNPESEQRAAAKRMVDAGKIGFNTGVVEAPYAWSRVNQMAHGAVSGTFPGLVGIFSDEAGQNVADWQDENIPGLKSWGDFAQRKVEETAPGSAERAFGEDFGQRMFAKQVYDQYREMARKYGLDFAHPNRVGQIKELKDNPQLASAFSDIYGDKKLRKFLSTLRDDPEIQSWEESQDAIQKASIPLSIGTFGAMTRPLSWAGNMIGKGLRSTRLGNAFPKTTKIITKAPVVGMEGMFFGKPMWDQWKDFKQAQKELEAARKGVGWADYVEADGE